MLSRFHRRNVLISPRMEQLEDRVLLASVSWDGRGDGFSWDDDFKWSVGQSLTVTGVVDFGNNPITTTNLTIAGPVPGRGDVTGSGDITVNGLFTWTGGTISGSGDVNANGGIMMGAAAPKSLGLLGRTLNNVDTAV